MSTFLELEIYALLKEHQQENGDAAVAADRLIQNIEDSEELMTAENIQSLAAFLWHCGYHATLLDFILRHIGNENFPIPWSYFAQVLGVIGAEQVSDKVLHALQEGIEKSKAQDEISRSKALDNLIPEIVQWRQDYRYRQHRSHRTNKKNYLEQLITLRTQQLYEQEKDLLQLLQRLYPGDEDVIRETKEHQQRYALEILARRARPTASTIDANEDEEALPEDQYAVLENIFLCMQEKLQHTPELAYDFAVAAVMLDRPLEAQHFLDQAAEDDAQIWLHLELLLRNKHYLELLQALAKIEVHYAEKSDTFFATAYLRAQAMWGMGQKHTAIEIMESLLSARPHYRSGDSLLSLWRNS